MEQEKSNNLKAPTVAIVLAAGKGKRMGTEVAKQFLDLNEKPLLYYSLKVFEESSYIDEIVLVTNEEGLSVCEAIVKDYDFTKVSAIVLGGKERYHSVWQGLKTAALDEGDGDRIAPAYVLIHDGARPFVTEEIIRRNIEALSDDSACVTAVPSKDTVKIADEEGFVAATPDRALVWSIQTPQSFDFSLVYRAYKMLIEAERNGTLQGIRVTDDAMVVEHFSDARVKLVEGSYENIKITTPEDLIIAESIVKRSLK